MTTQPVKHPVFSQAGCVWDLTVPAGFGKKEIQAVEQGVDPIDSGIFAKGAMTWSNMKNQPGTRTAMKC